MYNNVCITEQHRCSPSAQLNIKPVEAALILAQQEAVLSVHQPMQPGLPVRSLGDPQSIVAIPIPVFLAFFQLVMLLHQMLLEVNI